MELRHASIALVQKAKNGQKITVEQDVLDVVGQVKEIDPNLSVHWDEAGYFEIKELCPDGKERLVTTTLELDQRLLEHLRMISSPGWDVGREIDRAEALRDRELDHAYHERVGPLGEKAAHALRKDLQAKNRIFLPRGVECDA